MMVRVQLARLTRPLRWRSPRVTARMLAAFARAERSSYLDMMAAANATSSSTRRVEYLRHAIDEQRHARMFRQRALELDPDLAFAPQLFHADCEQLFERLGEAQLLAFVHVGERRGRAQMALYRAELSALANGPRGDLKTLSLFEAILRDEERHERYSLDLSRELGGSLSKARGWELWRSFRRAGSSMSSLLFFVSMAALYVALLPLAVWERTRRS